MPWEHRGRRTDEYLEVLRTLWVDNPSSYHGETYDLPTARCSPSRSSSPTRRSTSAARPPPPCDGRPVWARAGTPSTVRPRELATGLSELDAHLEAAGRSRADIRITVCPYFQQLTPEAVGQYAEAGADAVAALFFAFTPDDVARAFDDLEACREGAARAAT